MLEREKTCCFTGHRCIPNESLDSLKRQLKREIEKLIQQGVIYFGAGGALGFDTLAAEAVLELKQQYPFIKLILVLPCPDRINIGKRRTKGFIRKSKAARTKLSTFLPIIPVTV